jgi:hypothetical protein
MALIQLYESVCLSCHGYQKNIVLKVELFAFRLNADSGSIASS